MATDVRVVIPNDIGETIKLGVRTPNKYDVDITQLDLPAGLTSFELQGSTLVANTNKGPVQIDLTPAFPQIAADAFLKNVVRQDNEIVFTVGVQDGSRGDTEFRIDVADLLPVQSDGETIQGDGTATNKLRVPISAEGGNLLKKATDGLVVSYPDVENLVMTVVNDNPVVRDIRLVNATGTEVVGYIHSTEE